MKADKAETSLVSIIIPALNEARSIAKTLDAVARLRGSIEVIVVDGGSADATAKIARGRGVKVLVSEPGRGRQMHVGACAARGAALWFVHADTIVPPEAASYILNALDDPHVAAGNFHVVFEGTTCPARFLTWLYPQLRKLGLCYGDSAIFVRSEAYQKVGGFQFFPIFEDLDILRRLKKIGTIVHLPLSVVTSSRRFEGRSFMLTFCRWSLLQLFYWLGVNPQTLARLYKPIRNR